jgi:hypothetical protein
LFVCLRDLDVGELSAGVLDVALDVLADDGLLVVAGNVVPFDTVLSEVEQVALVVNYMNDFCNMASLLSFSSLFILDIAT